MKRLWWIIPLVIVVGLAGVYALHKSTQQPSNADPKAQAIAPTKTYAALGDSVAAGLGLKTASDWRYCGQTQESYPYAVAKAVNMKLHDASCRDAQTSAGILASQDSNGATLEPQLTQLYKGQKPSLISITIGANDIQWTKLLQLCYVASCGSVADTAQATTGIAGVGANLRTILSGIEANYPNATPKVVLTGYYQVFPTARDADCFELSRIDQTEMNWWRGQEDALNDTIRDVTTEFAFAHYAPVSFTGHELCTSEPWIQDLQSKAPLHPTSDGQAAIANAVIQAAR